MLSSRRMMPVSMRSTRSASTGRLRSACCSDRSSLSRSNGSRLPFFFTTINSRSCTRSKVVNRPPHAGQWRRRRMAELSSLGRLSLTCESSCPQNGHRMDGALLSPELSPNESYANIAALTIDGKLAAKVIDAAPDLGFDVPITFAARRAERIHHLNDHPGNLTEFA